MAAHYSRFGRRSRVWLRGQRRARAADCAMKIDKEGSSRQTARLSQSVPESESLGQYQVCY